MDPQHGPQRPWHAEFKILRGHLRARRYQAFAEAAASSGSSGAWPGAAARASSVARPPGRARQALRRWLLALPITPI